MMKKKANNFYRKKTSLTSSAKSYRACLKDADDLPAFCFHLVFQRNMYYPGFTGRISLAKV
jgi:hypothetical protein